MMEVMKIHLSVATTASTAPPTPVPPPQSMLSPKCKKGHKHLQSNADEEAISKRKKASNDDDEANDADTIANAPAGSTSAAEGEQGKKGSGSAGASGKGKKAGKKGRKNRYEGRYRALRPH